MTYTINPLSTIHTTQVSGKTFNFWSDYRYSGTLAQDLETGEIKKIYGGGYIHKDLTVRKAIAYNFSLLTFKTEAPKAETPTKTRKEKTPEQKAKAAARRKARREAKKAASKA